jgi:hypothetical protein
MMLTRVLLCPFSRARSHEINNTFLLFASFAAVHGIIEIGPADTSQKRNTFFKNVSYNIGGEAYTLDQIEHGTWRAVNSCNALV